MNWRLEQSYIYKILYDSISPYTWVPDCPYTNPMGKKNDHFNSPSDIDHAPQLFISQLFSQITSNAFQIPGQENLKHAGNHAVSGGKPGEFSGLKGKKQPLQDEICFNYRVAYFPGCVKSIPQLILPQCKACILRICLAWQIVFGNMAFMPISLGEKSNLFNPLVFKPLKKNPMINLRIFPARGEDETYEQSQTMFETTTSKPFFCWCQNQRYPHKSRAWKKSYHVCPRRTTPELELLEHFQPTVKTMLNRKNAIELHPRKRTWNQNMEVWKIIFLFKGMIFSFEVFRGVCDYDWLFSEYVVQCSNGNACYEVWPTWTCSLDDDNNFSRFHPFRSEGSKQVNTTKRTFTLGVAGVWSSLLNRWPAHILTFPGMEICPQASNRMFWTGSVRFYRSTPWLPV